MGEATESDASARFAVMVLKRAPGAAGFCSGVVLSPRVVLTAGHCVARPADTRIHFRDGSGQPVLIAVARVSVHPEYRADAVRSRTRSIDLALVETSQALPDSFTTAVLDDARGSPEGALVRLSGFGMSREGEAASSGALRTAVMEVRAPLSSVLLWLRDPSRKGAGACTGDSGGPVVSSVTSRLIAITSWSAGEGGRHCGALTQAVLVAPQRAWIARVMTSWDR